MRLESIEDFATKVRAVGSNLWYSVLKPKCHKTVYMSYGSTIPLRAFLPSFPSGISGTSGSLVCGLILRAMRLKHEEQHLVTSGGSCSSEQMTSRVSAGSSCDNKTISIDQFYIAYILLHASWPGAPVKMKQALFRLIGPCITFPDPKVDW